MSEVVSREDHEKKKDPTHNKQHGDGRSDAKKKSQTPNRYFLYLASLLLFPRPPFVDSQPCDFIPIIQRVPTAVKFSYGRGFQRICSVGLLRQ